MTRISWLNVAGKSKIKYLVVLVCWESPYLMFVLSYSGRPICTSKFHFCQKLNSLFFSCIISIWTSYYIYIYKLRKKYYFYSFTVLQHLDAKFRHCNEETNMKMISKTVLHSSHIFIMILVIFQLAAHTDSYPLMLCNYCMLSHRLMVF